MTIVKSTLFMTCLMLLFTPGCKRISTPGQLMSEYADKGHRRKIKSPFQGAVLIGRDGKIIFSEAYGFSDRENQIANTVDTRFPIASVTKQFTAFLVLKMVELGHLKLDDSTRAIYPALNHLDERITIHHLLSHTSGLPHYEGLEHIGYTYESIKTAKLTPDSLASLIELVPLNNEPGTKYQYSSLGYLLLGGVLEHVSGESYSYLLNKYISEPFGLKSTGFKGNNFFRDSLAQGYTYKEAYGLDWWMQENGGFIEKALPRDQSTKFSTGGIHSTVEDLFIWSEKLKRSEFLKPELTQQMLTPNQDGYCYGLIRNWDDLVERDTTARMYMHSGALPGFRSSIAMFDDGVTVIFLSNISPINDKEVLHHLHLKALGKEDKYRMQGYPDRSSLDKFKEEGGMKAFNNYFKTLSDYCGHQVLPSENSVNHLIYLYSKNGETAKSDSLLSWYKSNYAVSFNSTNELGYDLLSIEDCDHAIELFIENSKKYPKNPNSWDSLGDGFKKCGNIKNARECYEKAVTLAEQLDDPNYPVYKSNLDNL